MKLFKRRNAQVEGSFCETCGEICDAACSAERRLDAIKTTWQSGWGLGRVGR